MFRPVDNAPQWYYKQKAVVEAAHNKAHKVRVLEMECEQKNLYIKEMEQKLAFHNRGLPRCLVSFCCCFDS